MEINVYWWDGRSQICVLHFSHLLHFFIVADKSVSLLANVYSMSNLPYANISLKRSSQHFWISPCRKRLGILKEEERSASLHVPSDFWGLWLLFLSLAHYWTYSLTFLFLQTCCSSLGNLDKAGHSSTLHMLSMWDAPYLVYTPESTCREGLHMDWGQKSEGFALSHSCPSLIKVRPSHVLLYCFLMARVKRGQGALSPRGTSFLPLFLCILQPLTPSRS